MNNLVIQTRARAALKTFLQAFFGVLATVMVPVLAGWSQLVANGEQIALDVRWFVLVLLAASGAGAAALISFVWNTLNAKE